MRKHGIATKMHRKHTRALSLFVLCAFLWLSLPWVSAQRQPAPVMGSSGAGWLTRPERIEEEQPDRMLSALNIKKGSVVADVGAGVGYHVWRMAGIVGPTGRVIAEDIQEDMLRMLK